MPAERLGDAPGLQSLGGDGEVTPQGSGLGTGARLLHRQPLTTSRRRLMGTTGAGGQTGSGSSGGGSFGPARRRMQL